jgi:hypothetical protein
MRYCLSILFAAILLSAFCALGDILVVTESGTISSRTPSAPGMPGWPARTPPHAYSSGASQVGAAGPDQYISGSRVVSFRPLAAPATSSMLAKL